MELPVSPSGMEGSEPSDWSLIAVWKTHIEEIVHGNEGKRNAYMGWLEAIREGKAEKSLNCAHTLQADAGKPLYEYLVQQHALRFGIFLNLREEQWWKLFEQGELDELEKRLKERSTELKPWEQRAWQDRIEQTKRVAEYLAVIRNPPRWLEWAGNYQVLLQALIPSYIWDTAKKVMEEKMQVTPNNRQRG
jgi:hypothetical protein